MSINPKFIHSLLEASKSNQLREFLCAPMSKCTKKQATKWKKNPTVNKYIILIIKYTIHCHIQFENKSQLFYKISLQNIDKCHELICFIQCSFGSDASSEIVL